MNILIVCFGFCLLSVAWFKQYKEQCTVLLTIAVRLTSSDYGNFVLSHKSLRKYQTNPWVTALAQQLTWHRKLLFFSESGLIVGTVVGGIFLLCCVAFTWFMVKRIKSRKRATSNSVPDPSESHTTQSQQPATELPHSQSLGATAEARSGWPHAEIRTSWAPAEITTSWTRAEIHDPKFSVEVPPRYQEQPPPPYSIFGDPPPPYPGALQDT